MDQWDPMMEAYENRNFNCYNQGVGRDLLGSSRCNKGVNLYVQGIPPGLGKNGFFNMFAEYGPITEYKLITSGNEDSRGSHGFIIYENMLDAETAIGHLDKKKLGKFTLRVTPALSEEEKNRRRRLKQDEEMMYSYIRRDTAARANDITSSFSNLPYSHQPMEDRSRQYIHESSSQFQNYDSGSWNQQLVGVGRGNIFQGMERENARHHSLHSVGLRGSHYSSQENLDYHQKHLSLGYQDAPVQERYQAVEDRNFVRQSCNITPPKGPKAVKTCVYCYKGGCVTVCSKCKMYYCSDVCQKIDWPRHREICHTIGDSYGSVADLSSIPHSNDKRLQDSAGAYTDDDDVERIHSQFAKDTKVQNAHRNDRGLISDNTMIEFKGQNMRQLNENRRRGPPASAEHVDHLLHAAKVQNNTSGMIKGNDYVNKAESHRGKETKTPFSKGPGQSQIVSSSNNNKRNFENSHERGTYRHQDEGATAQVSQKCSTPTNNKNNSNNRDFETKEAFSRTQAAPMSSSPETRVKEMGAPVKSKSGENMGNKKRNQDFQSKHEEKTASLNKQKLNTKTEEEGRNVAKALVVKADEKLLSAVELTLPVNTSGKCFLTYFESPYKFWISLQDYLEVFTETTQLMGQAISDNSDTTNVACKVGGTYGVKCMGDWCRVTVTSITDMEITVFFIDYGNQSVVKQEDLRRLTVDMLELPAQAVCCCISKLKPKGSDSWSEAASAAMKQWLGEPMSKFLQFEVVTKRGSVHAVNISHNQKTLRDALLAGGFAEKVDAEPGLPSLTSNPARPMAGSVKSRMDGMKSGDKVTGEFTDFTSSDRFTVIDVASASLMVDFSSSLQAEYKNSTVPYIPVQGELVATQFSDDQKWYRAEVTNVDGDNYTLYFVDYGNSEVQKVENIRRVTNKIFIEAPKQALVCSLFTAQTLSGYSSEIVDQEIKKLLATAVNSEGHISLIVKDKAKEALLVDIINTSGKSLSDELIHKLSGKSLSDELIHKLSELSIEKHSTNANRLIDVGNSTRKANKPVLESMVTMSELGMETFAVESGKTISVLMSVIKSPKEFYVRQNSKNEQFVAMMKELDRSISSSPKLTVPSVGILTAVQCSQNRIWCRGVIEKLEDKKCVVRFLDYGNSEEALMSALTVLPPSVCHLPAQAIRCRLDGRLQNLSSASVLKFKEMERSSVDVKVCGNDSGVFSVQVFQGGTDVGASLIDSCSQHTSTVEPISAVVRPKVVSDILTETLPATGEPVTAVVTYIDSCSRLFIACKDVTGLLKSADSLPYLSNPVVGRVCAAQYSLDKAWYRGRIVQIKSPKTCIVQFLDYGNSEETSVSNLRELGPDMCKLPGQAICCCLSGYEQDLGLAAPHRPTEKATELTNKLQLELLEKIVTVRVVGRKSDVWIVKLENEHGECINTKYKPTSREITVTPRLSDLTFEYPPDAEFEAFFSHINSLSDFYCQMCNAEMLAELGSLSEHLRNDVSRLVENTLVQPVVNGVYTSKYMDNWYRCVVEEVRNTRVLIKYIDYGNSEEILASQLRPLSPERLQMPVRLMRCKLYGVTPVQENWSNPEMPGYLEIFRQNRVHLAIETRDTDVFHVSVFILQGSEKVSVAADLVDMGLAKFLQVVSPQKDESRSLPAAPPKPSQQSAHEQDDDEFDEEMALQRQIQELQMQLLLSKQKKKQK